MRTATITTTVAGIGIGPAILRRSMFGPIRGAMAGGAGDEHIFAVASYDYINPPDFMKYVGYDYGDNSYYDDDYFAIKVRGSLDNFVGSLNAPICSGPCVVADTRFLCE